MISTMTTILIVYARCSTGRQNLAAQRATLEGLGARLMGRNHVGVVVVIHCDSGPELPGPLPIKLRRCGYSLPFSSIRRPQSDGQRVFWLRFLRMLSPDQAVRQVVTSP